jgi:hypothetical protein
MPREETDEKESLPSDTKRQQASTGGSTTSALDSAPSFFSSIFFGGQNDNRNGGDMRNEIHTQLNMHEELQIMRSHRRKMPEPEPQQHHASQSQRQSSSLPKQQQQQQQQQQPPHRQQPWTDTDENDHPTRPTKIQNLAGVADRVKGWFSSTSEQQSRISYRAADGAYYVISQDPRDGARIDVQPPFMMPKGKENGGVRVEVVRENGPCQIRWTRDNSERVVAGSANTNTNANNFADQGLGQHIAIALGQEHASGNYRKTSKPKLQKPPKSHHPLIELDDYVDCARLSAEIYRTRNLLTLTAPVKQVLGTGKLSNQPTEEQQQSPPRFVPVVKRS